MPAVLLFEPGGLSPYDASRALPSGGFVSYGDALGLVHNARTKPAGTVDRAHDA